MSPQAEVLPVAKGRSEALAKSQEVLALMPGLTAEVKVMEITSDSDYNAADALLGRVRQARAGWGRIWERIQEKTIKPIRSGLDELYQMDRDVDRPLEALETTIKVRMKAYKQEELRQIQAAKQAQEAEAARLRREAEAKAEAEANAKTAQMRGKLAAARERIEQQVAQVEAQEAPEPVRGWSSGTRTKKAWRITDMDKVLTAVLAGEAPRSIVLWNDRELNRLVKDDPDGLAAIPGIELFDDINIVGR